MAYVSAQPHRPCMCIYTNVYKYTYKCMYLYNMCVYIHICITFICILVNIHTNMYTYMYQQSHSAQLCVYIPMFTSIHINVCIYAICVNIYIYVSVCVNIYIYSMYTYMYQYSHTAQAVSERKGPNDKWLMVCDTSIVSQLNWWLADTACVYMYV